MATLRQVLSTEAVDAEHRKRFIADTRKANAAGMSVHAWRAQRSRAIEAWTKDLHELLDQHGVDEVAAIMPEILTSFEQRIIAEAREAAAVAAREQIGRLLRKAISP
jgi:hypothetical protein